MVKRLLNLYIKHMEETDKKVWKKIISLPKRIIAQMLAALICITLTILFSVFTNVDVNILNDPELWSTICTIVYVFSAIIAVLFCGISQISIGKYEIEISTKTMDEYWSYCHTTKKWIVDLFGLKDTGEISVIKEIEAIKDRVDSYRKELIDDAEKRANRMDKWVQALAVPFVLAIITAVIDKNDDIGKAVAVILAIVIIGIALFGIVWISNNFKSLLRKQKDEQLKLLSEDLQGIIDAEHYCINLGKVQIEKK